MSDNSLSGKVGLDVTDFKSGITELNRNIRVVESGFQAAAAGLGDWSKSASGLELRIKALSSEIDIQKSKVAALAAEHARVAAEQGSGSRAAQDLEIRLNKETATLGKMESELGTTQSSLTEMGNASGEAAKETDNLGKKESETTGHTSKFASALEGLKSKLNAGVSGLKDMVVNVAKVGAGLAVGLVGATIAVGAAIGAAIMKTGEWADRFATLSGQTGISTKRLQELDYIGKKLDVDLEVITGSMSKLIRNMASAQAGTGKTADAFKALGVKVTDSKGNLRDSTTVYGEAITALGKVGNETERDALAMQIFGKSALELNPLISAGKDKLKELADEANRTGAVMSTDAVEAFDKFKDSVDSLGNSAKGIIGTLLVGLMPTLNQVVAWIQSTLIPWLQDNLPKAIQFLSNMWTTVLLPAIQSVWTWMSTVLMPFLQGLVDAFMIGFGPGVWNDWVTGISNALYSLGGPFATLGEGIVTLANFWNNTLLPALGNVWAYIVDNVIPRLSEVWTWLQTNLPAALQTAADFWNNTLLPALGNVWAYIVDNIIPRLAEMWTWLQTNVPAAIQTAADYFNNTLMPAMTTTKNYISDTLGPAINTFTTDTLPKWQTKNDEIAKQLAETFGPGLMDIFDIISKYVIPIFNTLNLIYLEAQIIALGILSTLWKDHLQPALESVSKFIKEHLTPNMDSTRGVLQDLSDAIDRIVRGALARFLQILQDIAKALLKIIIPPDIKPGSPTPFELGLRGINDAMAELNQMQLPVLAAHLSKLSLGSVGGFPGQTNNNQQYSWSYVIQAANPLQTSDDLARQVRLLELMHG